MFIIIHIYTVPDFFLHLFNITYLIVNVNVYEKEYSFTINNNKLQSVKYRTGTPSDVGTGKTNLHNSPYNLDCPGFDSKPRRRGLEGVRIGRVFTFEITKIGFYNQRNCGTTL